MRKRIIVTGIMALFTLAGIVYAGGNLVKRNAINSAKSGMNAVPTIVAPTMTPTIAPTIPQRAPTATVIPTAIPTVTAIPTAVPQSTPVFIPLNTPAPTTVSDNTPPTIVNLSGPFGSEYGTRATDTYCFLIKGNDNILTTDTDFFYQAFLDGNPVSDWNHNPYPCVSKPSPGTHAFTVQIKDKAGNVSATSGNNFEVVN